jgi:hypothetical protein
MAVNRSISTQPSLASTYLEDLSVRGFVAVADTELRGDGQTRTPDALEARLLDDLGAETVVGLHDELQLVRRKHVAQLLGLALLYDRCMGMLIQCVASFIIIFVWEGDCLKFTVAEMGVLITVIFQCTLVEAWRLEMTVAAGRTSPEATEEAWVEVRLTAAVAAVDRRANIFSSGCVVVVGRCAARVREGEEESGLRGRVKYRTGHNSPTHNKGASERVLATNP